MTEYRFCTVADEGRLRIVTINRPEVMNALHSEAHWEFDQIWNEFAADPIPSCGSASSPAPASALSPLATTSRCRPPGGADRGRRLGLPGCRIASISTSR